MRVQKFVLKFSVDFLCVSDFFRSVTYVCAGQSDFFQVFLYTHERALFVWLYLLVWGGRPFFVPGDCKKCRIGF